MTFPKNSAFHANQLPIGYGGPDRTPMEASISSLVKTTSVPTADIEDLEHELRDLSYDAGSPEDARLFEELADKVASFYKG